MLLLANLRNRAPKKSKAKSNLRPDIQGLRTFAVVAVIMDHLLGWPSGGFVGVDIFFVISGFLITGLLLREHDRTGRISFSDFYKRRIKRILPAAVLVLLVTSVAAFFVFNKVRAWNTFWDAAWAFLFAANWRQASIGTDYFAASGPVSPLQHYWSLAVEEQFYFIWPWLMLGLFAVAAKLWGGRANPRVVAGVAMGALTTASFAWAVWETSANQNLAYFSTFSRAWELGVGALLACAATLLPSLPDALRPLLAWFGLAGMVASLFVTDPAQGFPGPSAALPVLSTALVIAAGTGTSEHRFLAPLTNPVMNYVGNISYSLYLWHFPIVIFGESIDDDRGPIYYVVVSAAIFLSAIFSYHLLEDPVRKSKWLTGERHWTKHVSIPDGYKLTALAGLATVTVAVVGAAMMPPPAPTTPAFATKPLATTGAEDAPAASAPMHGPEVTQIQKEIKTALTASAWPENLNPTMDVAVGNHKEPDGVGECGKTVAPAATECVWGNPDAPKTAVLVGDSVAVAWVPALLKIYGEGEWKFLMRGHYGCPFVDRDPSQDNAACTEHKTATVADIAELRPDLLISANNYPDGGAPVNWANSEMKILTRATGAAQKIMLTSPPHGKDVQQCYKPSSTPADCVTATDGRYNMLRTAEETAAEAGGARYVDTSPLFCNAVGACPAFIGTTPVKLDAVHVTLWYGEKVAPALKELIG